MPRPSSAFPAPARPPLRAGAFAATLALALALPWTAPPPLAADPLYGTGADGTPLAAPPPDRAGAPVPTARLKIRLRSVHVQGNSLIPSAELEPLLAPAIGLECDLADLRALADKVTQEYKARGFFSARAFLPVQDIANGDIAISVLEGTVEDLVIEGNQHYSDEFIRSFLAVATTGKELNPQRLERALLLLNDFPKLKVSAYVQKGADPGTTGIVAKVEDRFPLRVTVDYNNFGTEAVSRSRFGLGLEWANALLDGAVLSARGVSGEDPSTLLYGSFRYAVPLDADGLRLSAGYSLGDFELAREFDALEVRGEQQAGDLTLSYPLIKTRFTSLSAEAGIEAKDTELYLLDHKSSNDEIRLVKAAAKWDSSEPDGGSRNFAALTLAQGLGPVLGGLHEDSPRASRSGADNSFTKVTAGAARLQKLSDTFSFLLRASGQLSTDSLVAGEEFQIGGADTVRGYPQGEFAGDRGYNLSAEFRIAPFEDKKTVQFVLFLDHGGVYSTRPLIGQDKSAYLTGGGAGVRCAFPHDIALSLDFGVPVDPPDSSSDDDVMVYVAASVQF